MADDAELQLGQSAILIVAQLENVIARLIGWQVVAEAIGGDGNLFRFRGPLFQHRLVGELTAFLLGQDRDVFLRNHVYGDIGERDPVELWIDRDQVDHARLVRVDVTQVAVRFAADHVR